MQRGTTSSAQPSVLVGIATHNRAQILPKAISSALAQSHRPLRVAVFDDACTDDTSALIPHFPDVDWIQSPTNQGYVEARNRMMLGASEDYYVSLDDDAWFIEGDEIALAVDFLERNQRVASITFDIVSPDRPQQRRRGEQWLVPVFIGCGHVLRLSLVRQLGGYLKYPGNYGGEEKDLCLQLIDAGHGVVLLEGVHVWHEKSMMGRDVHQQRRSGVCNDLSLTMRRTPAVFLGPALLRRLGFHLIFGLRHKLLWPYLLGIKDFSIASFQIWRGRRPVRQSTITAFRSLARAPRRLT